MSCPPSPPNLDHYYVMTCFSNVDHVYVMFLPNLDHNYGMLFSQCQINYYDLRFKLNMLGKKSTKVKYQCINCLFLSQAIFTNKQMLGNTFSYKLTF